jgi:hypothetical protein
MISSNKYLNEKYASSGKITVTGNPCSTAYVNSWTELGRFQLSAVSKNSSPMIALSLLVISSMPHSLSSSVYMMYLMMRSG